MGEKGGGMADLEIAEDRHPCNLVCAEGHGQALWDASPEQNLDGHSGFPPHAQVDSAEGPLPNASAEHEVGAGDDEAADRLGHERPA